MINIVALQGRLTFNTELKSTSSGTSVTNFQIAVERNYAPKGEQRQADFIDCVAFSHTAEFVHRWFKKGAMIAIEGRLQTRTWVDDAGNNRKAVEVVVNNASFCGEKKETAPENDFGYDNDDFI